MCPDHRRVPWSNTPSTYRAMTLLSRNGESMSTGLPGWEAGLDERLGLKGARAFASKTTVPVHRHSIWYYFGGMTLFLFSIQVVTGILLLLYYRPSADAAFESVQFIVTQVRFGWLIRSVHSWSANLMIATLFVHLF